MYFFFPFYLLVTTGYLVDASVYSVVTSGYLITTTGYFWLFLVTSGYFRFLVLVTTCNNYFPTTQINGFTYVSETVAPSFPPYSCSEHCRKYRWKSSCASNDCL